MEIEADSFIFIRALLDGMDCDDCLICKSDNEEECLSCPTYIKGQILKELDAIEEDN